MPLRQVGSWGEIIARLEAVGKYGPKELEKASDQQLESMSAWVEQWKHRIVYEQSRREVPVTI